MVSAAFICKNLRPSPNGSLGCFFRLPDKPIELSSSSKSLLRSSSIESAPTFLRASTDRSLLIDEYLLVGKEPGKF